MLVVMDKTTHEEHLSQPPLQTNNKQFKVAVTFLTGYSGNFNVTNPNNKLYFKKTITNENDFIQIIVPEGAHEIEALHDEIKRIIFDKGLYSGNEYPFSKKPNFSTLGSKLEISPQAPIIRFVFIDSIRNLSGFDETILYKEYNLSPDPVEILSFDNFFLETHFAHGMILDDSEVE